MVSVRPVGEVLAAEAGFRRARVVLFGTFPGRSRREVEGRLTDILEASWGAAGREDDPRPLPAPLHHAVAGLLSWFSELGGAAGGEPQAAVLFDAESRLAFAYTGSARPRIQVDGKPYEAPWIDLGSPGGLGGRAFSIYASRPLSLELTWSAAGDDGSARGTVHAIWKGEGGAPAAVMPAVVADPERDSPQGPRNLAGAPLLDDPRPGLETGLASAGGSTEATVETMASREVRSAGEAREEGEPAAAADEASRPPASAVAGETTRVRGGGLFGWLDRIVARRRAPSDRTSGSNAEDATVTAGVAPHAGEEAAPVSDFASGESSPSREGPAGAVAPHSSVESSQHRVPGGESIGSAQGVSSPPSDPAALAASRDEPGCASPEPGATPSVPRSEGEDDEEAGSREQATEPSPRASHFFKWLDRVVARQEQRAGEKPAPPPIARDVPGVPDLIPPTPEPPATAAGGEPRVESEPPLTAAIEEPDVGPEPQVPAAGGERHAEPRRPAAMAADEGHEVPAPPVSAAGLQRRVGPGPRAIEAGDEHHDPPEPPAPAASRRPREESQPPLEVARHEPHGESRAPVHPARHARHGAPETRVPGTASGAPAPAETTDRLAESAMQIPPPSGHSDRAGVASESTTEALETMAAPGVDEPEPAFPGVQHRASSGAVVRRAPRRPAWPEAEELTPHSSRWRRKASVALLVVVLFAGGWSLGSFQGGRHDAAAGRSPWLGALAGLLGGGRFECVIRSIPDGAWITVDGRDLARRTPAALELSPGEHQIALTLPDLGTATYMVRGVRGERTTLDATLQGSLTILAPDSEIPITVSVDGQARGLAPITIEGLIPGTHEVQFSGPGVTPWGQTVEIGVQQENRILARPFHSPETGIMDVRTLISGERGVTSLEGAKVWIDGAAAGTTPLSLDLPRGPHSIRVESSGEQPPVQVIDLPGGNQRFATFAFGTGIQHPRFTLLSGQGELPRDRPAVVSAALDGVSHRELSEMWLHVQTPEGPWRRYPMTALASPGGSVGVTVFPMALLDADGRAPYYLSALASTGDEYFTEIQNAKNPKLDRGSRK